MRLFEIVKRGFIWLRRFRHRKGYGVHSPFAFSFITRVVYEKGPYYKYDLFKQLPSSRLESTKIAKLLFRLVNYQQPNQLFYQTNGSDISSLFRWAKSDVQIFGNMDNSYNLDLAYIALTPDQSDKLMDVIDQIHPYLHDQSMLIVYGIGYNREMKKCWTQIIADPKSGITFDLYDVGIVFFDKTKNKQDYIVNF